MSSTSAIEIRYFAILRDRSGKSRESLAISPGETPRSLYDQISVRYGFEIPASDLRVAINKQFGDFDTALHHGDEVAFIPPVAGG